MTNLPNSIAERIRELRLAKGWSQERMAEEAGLSTDAISRIERGNRGPRLETVAQIAGALGMPLTKLVDFGEPPPRRRKPKDDLMNAGEQLLEQMSPELAKEVISAIRGLVKAQLREKGRKRSTAANRDRGK
jgi:transcriptional regulator with XRE-family HTH domain